MFARRPLHRLVVGVTLFVLVALVVSSPVVAQRGGGGGGGGGGGAVPAGTIYFSSDGVSTSMKADGTGKAASTVGMPSYQKHGSRWFLQMRYLDIEEHGVDEFESPVYWSVYDIAAVSETGATVSLGTTRGGIDFGYCKWGKGDSFISFTTAVDTNGVVSGGLVVVPISWVNNSPVAGQPVPALEAYTTVYGDVNLYSHDWSAAGDEVVVQSIDLDSGEWQLYVADLSGTEPAVQPLVEGMNPDWSAATGRIAYSREVFLAGDTSTEIWTVSADGSSPVRVTQAAATSSSRRWQGGASWSPDGTLIAFTEVFTKGNKTTRNVLRAAATGGLTTALTSDGKSASAKWRQ